MFQNNFPCMNFNQINPMMMNNQMLNQPFKNQIFMDNMIQNQINNDNINDNIQNEEDMAIFYLNDREHKDYDCRLNILRDKRKSFIFKDITKNKMIIKYLPIYFTKRDLYSYINQLNSNKTVLFYNNNILNNDESSIEDIPDNSTILLFVQPYHNNLRNSSLYKYIMNLFKNSENFNIITEENKGIHAFIFPIDISIYLMIKLISYELQLDDSFHFLFNGDKIDIYNKTKIKNFIANNSKIIIYSPKNIFNRGYFFGKKTKVTMFYIKTNIFKSEKVYKYSPISELFDIFKDDNSKNIRIIYKGKELNKNDNHSLASLGINDDFECIII